MANELNDLLYDNTKVTVTGATNNTATSDELDAPLMYQTKMGTNYSRSKGVVRAFNFAGISLILTAAAIKTGSLISNVYILNPPSVGEVKYIIEHQTFSAEFIVSNKGKYHIDYFFYVNDVQILKEDCSEEKTYYVSYDNLLLNDECRFYIEFSNEVDYKKVIENYSFKVEA